MHRFFVPPDWIDDDTVSITGDVARHGVMACAESHARVESNDYVGFFGRVLSPCGAYDDVLTDVKNVEVLFPAIFPLLFFEDALV